MPDSGPYRGRKCPEKCPASHIISARACKARYCTVNRGFSLFRRGAPPSPIVSPTSDRAMPRPYPPPRSARPSRDLDDLSPRRPCRHDRADRRQSQRSTAVAMAPRLLSRDLSPENARPAPPPPSTRRGRPLRPLGACFYRTGLRPTFRNGVSATGRRGNMPCGKPANGCRRSGRPASCGTCGESFDSHRLEESLIHVPHLSAAHEIRRTEPLH